MRRSRNIPWATFTSFLFYNHALMENVSKLLDHIGMPKTKSITERWHKRKCLRKWNRLVRNQLANSLIIFNLESWLSNITGGILPTKNTFYIVTKRFMFRIRNFNKNWRFSAPNKTNWLLHLFKLYFKVAIKTFHNFLLMIMIFLLNSVSNKSHHDLITLKRSQV